MKSGDVTDENKTVTENNRRRSNVDYFEDPLYQPRKDLENKYYFQEIEIPPLIRSVLSYKDGEPRLIIDRLVLRNFKSFYGEITIGPFNTHLSCIVGPNGSGKSNIIDSLLFVFGFRSSKTRAKSIANLIHLSALHQNCSECSVTVKYKKIRDISYEEWESVENSEFEVTRKAFFLDGIKSNCKSQYYFNKEAKSQKDIVALLKSHGIDLEHNRFLILQGEVEQIALMKHKGQKENEEGMLEYLEDIIGSNRYIIPIDIALKRRMVMERMREQIAVQAGSVRAEVEILKKDRDEAVHYYELSNNIVRFNHKTLTFKIFKAEQSLIDSEEIYNKKMTEENVCKEEMCNNRDKMKEETASLNSMKIDLNNKEKHEKKLMDEFSKKEKNYEELRQEKNQYKTELKKLEQSLSKDQKDLEKLVSSFPAYEPKIIEKGIKKKTIDEKIIRLQSKIDDENALNKVDAKMHKLEEDLAKFSNNLLEKERNVLSKESEWRETESKIHVMQKDEQSCKQQYDQLKLSCEKNDEDYDRCNNDLNDFKPTYEGLKEQLSKEKHNLQKITNDMVSLREKILKYRDTFESAQSNQNAVHQQTIVKLLFEQQRNGNIHGFLGRLGDLGGIDQKYDVAISTACGGMLDRLLFETGDDVKECIDYLKKNNSGRHNFLSLDKQIERCGRKCLENFTGPIGNFPRLFDLIKPANERFKPAFYAATGNRVVAKNVEEGRKVAFGSKRFDVACLDGVTISSTGSIRGGRNCARRGKMGSESIVSNVSIDIDQIQFQLNQAESEMESLSSKQQNLLESIRKKESELKHLGQKMSQLTSAFNKYEKMKNILSDQLVEKKRRLQEATPNILELKKLEKLRDKQKQAYDSSNEEIQKDRDAVEELKNEIDEKTNGVTRKLRNEMNDFRSELEKLVIVIDTLTKEKNKNERNIRKLEKNIDENTRKVDTLKNKMENIKNVGGKLGEELKLLDEEINKGKDKIEELRKQFADNEKIESELKTEYNALRCKMQELAEATKTALNHLKSIKHSLEKYREEKNHLVLEKLPDDEMDPIFEEIDKESLENLNVDKELLTIKNELEELEEEKQSLEGKINFQSFKKYTERKLELDKYDITLTNMKELLEKQTDLYDELKNKRTNEFLLGIKTISDNVKQMYKLITNGGDADLECSIHDPFSEGVKFNVRPPNKAWKEILNLSGGEKTLSSMALVFALHLYLPTPLYFMDEIDAALDYKNVSIVANYIRKRTQNAQFIVISLRQEMFELADRLVGISKRNDMTRVVCVNPRVIEKLIHALPPPALRLNGLGQMTSKASQAPLSQIFNK